MTRSPSRANSRILILGGAGFIGSNLARHLSIHHEVTVIDGLLPQTGGSLENLQPCLGRIRLIQSRLEEVNDLDQLLSTQNVIIDSMAWTAHLLGMQNPSYDLALNQASHLYMIEALGEHPGKRLLYLGSRSQYGNPNSSEIDENTPLHPVDPQGIHKSATESYFRIFSKPLNLKTVSLRLPNVYGPNQPVRGQDIGLVGSMIRDVLNGKPLEVFGRDRHRHVLYVKDLCAMVSSLIDKDWMDFDTFNVGGERVAIRALADLIVEATGKGAVICKELPPEIHAIDSGGALFRDEKIRQYIPNLQRTTLSSGLLETIQYFKAREK